MYKRQLYTYLTQPEEYDRIMEESRERLEKSLPKVCAYFNRSEFRNLSEELQFYEKNVQSHYKESVSYTHLYPGGEGAGYAGGIMSAAVDGIKIAEKIIEEITADYNFS